MSFSIKMNVPKTPANQEGIDVTTLPGNGKLSRRQRLKLLDAFAGANKRLAAVLDRQDKAQGFALAAIADIIAAVEGLTIIRHLPAVQRILNTLIVTGNVLAGKIPAPTPAPAPLKPGEIQIPFQNPAKPTDKPL